MSNKIIRSICLFTDDLNSDYLKKMDEILEALKSNEYEIQTTRLCSKNKSMKELEKHIDKRIHFLSVGKLEIQEIENQLGDFFELERVSFNIDLTNEKINNKHTEILFKVIKNKPEQTFNFSYSFNSPNSTPFFTSTNYEKNGFSIGLQSTNLSVNCDSLDEWLLNMKNAWKELTSLFEEDKDFLGIDSSIAPLYEGESSFINFIKRLGYDFSETVVTDIYTKITNFIKNENPKMVGLNGLMFPALEDFDLADEYEKGNFSIERNIYLSLHSGLGIDTYPIGIDEDPQKVTEILKLVQALSNKYKKSLAVRFVSDGKAKIGEVTNFQNQFLKNIRVRKL